MTLLRGPDPERGVHALSCAVCGLSERPLDAGDRMILGKVMARVRNALARVPRHIPALAEIESRVGVA